jgi:hypothetical protein
MRRAIVLLILGGLALAMFVTGVAMMLMTPNVNAIPTPGFGVVGGVIAMFGTLGVFTTGFVLLATEPD